MTSEEIAHSCSDEIDKIILKYIQEGNTFGAGRFYIKWHDDNSFKYTYVMYFRNPENEALEVSGENTVPLTYMAEPDRSELYEKREIAYEIDAPLISDATAIDETAR